MDYLNGIQPQLASEVAVIGAGPIGLELAAALKRAGVDYQQFEARQIGYTLTWWPRNTQFFSTTERIEIAGIPAPTTTQGRLTGEEYLAYLRGVIEQLDLQVNTYERVVDIQRQRGGFLLRTRRQTGERTCFCRKLVLATGDMATPNRLGIPGEDLPHVSHYFHDPHDYFRQRLLIVGGRNSAAEAALRCWRGGSQVTISYRQGGFDERVVKHWILPDLRTQIELGNIGFLPETLPVEIQPGYIVLERLLDGSRFEHPTDFVLLNTGFVADLSLFEMAGVNLQGKERIPEFDPESMETNIPSVFVAGTAAAGNQSSYTLFIENTHVHVGRILRALTGRWPDRLGTIASRQYDQPIENIQSN